MIALFLIIALQDVYFEDLYKSGLEKIDRGNYVGAVRDLEAAIKERPESKEKARSSYGVQFVEYLPYHHLAHAWAKLDNPERARFYLNKAYEYGEHEVKSKPTQIKVALTRDLTELLERSAAEREKNVGVADTAQPKGPDISAILSLIISGSLDMALDEIRRNQAEFPNETELEQLFGLVESIQNSQKIEQQAQEAKRELEQRITDLTRKAKANLEAENFEEALRNYVALRILDEENEDAAEAIPFIQSKLRDEGKTAEEITLSLNQAIADNAQLVKEKENYQRQAEEANRLAADTQQKFEILQSSRARTPSIFDVVWNITSQNRKEHTASVGLEIKGNRPSDRAELLVNNQRVHTWNTPGGQNYRLPMLPNVTFKPLDNQLKIVLYYEGQEIYSDTHTQNFVPPDPIFTKKVKRILILIGAGLILVFFAARQLRKRKAFRERFNPYIAGAPVLNEKMFYGRHQMIKQILNTLHNNSLMIYGERRIGKTSFLHQLNATLPTVEDDTYVFIPVLIDLQGVREEDFFTTIDHEITLVMEQQNYPSDQVEQVSYRQFVSRLRKRVQFLKENHQKKPKLVLLLDEVDVMNSFSEHTNQQLRSVFMKGFAEHLVAVMAGIHIKTRWESEGSPWYNFFEQIELKPFTKNHSDALITRPVNGVYNYSKEAVARIEEVAKGKPYLIQKMCLNLVAHILAENKRQITVEDVNQVFGEIKQEFYGAEE